MSLNVIQVVQGALTESVLQQIAERFGVAPDATRRVVDVVAPALVGLLMHKAASPDGARGLFNAIMSPDSNGDIVAQLPQFLHGDALQELLDRGSRLATLVAPPERFDALSRRAAEHTGVAASAAHGLTGLVATVMFGVLKHYLTQNGSSIGHLPTLLVHHLPQVKANMTEDIASALGLGGGASFLYGAAAQLKAVSTHLALMRPTAVPHASGAALDRVVVAEKAGNKVWWWVGATAALALLAALLGRSCIMAADVHSADKAPEVAVSAQGASASAAVADAFNPAAQPAPERTAPASMRFAVDPSGLPTLTAGVGSEEEKAALLDALTTKFGAGRFNANVTVDAATQPAAWLDKLDGLLPLMALPGAEVKLTGEHIELSGAAARANLGWADKLQAWFGDTMTVGTFDVGQAVASAHDSFANALDALAADDCAPADIAHVLNLQVINFSTGSGAAPDDARAGLARSAALLTRCASAGQAVRLEVAGYSDNVGDAAGNLALSKQRAQAVLGYLVEQGVKPETLTAAGYGDARPVADNDTESGRFANRRIEFVMKD